MQGLLGLFRRAEKGRVPRGEREGVVSVPALSPERLLAERRSQVHAIWRQLGIYMEDREVLFDAPLARLTALVGALPASEDYHGCEAGGLLTHTLETAEGALDALGSAPTARSADESDDPVAREHGRVPLQYETFCGALLHDVGKVFFMRVTASEGEPWRPLVEDLWSYARRHGAQELSVEHVTGRGLHRHEGLSALFLERVVGLEGLEYMGPEAIRRLLRNLRAHRKEGIDLGPGGRVAQAVRTGDEESTRRDRMARLPELPGDAAPGRTLADDAVEGLVDLLAAGELRVNGKRAEVYVGREATALVVPAAVRMAVEHLRRQDPDNRRLWTVKPRNEAPVFNALAERGWLIAAGRRAVLAAQVHYPGPGHTHEAPLNMVVMKNEVLWRTLPRPEPFAGRIAFKDGTTGEAVPVAGFDETAPCPAEPAPAVPEGPFAHLLEDLARVARENGLGANRPGGQLFVFGETSLVVVPKALKKAMELSGRAYPEPYGVHMNAAYDALAATGRVRSGPGGRVFRRAEIEHIRAPLGVVAVETAALLDEEQRAAWGDYAGGFRYLEDEGGA